MSHDETVRVSEPVPISALQHAVYCLRQAALIHLERLWEENRYTAEGRVLHVRADQPKTRRQRGVRQAHALPLASRRLGIAGIADLVEFIADEDGETPRPVEIKRGKPKLHRADEVQLCAQALCLEEMTGRVVPEGALFYAETRKRVTVPMDAPLRELTEATIADLARLLHSGRTPPPTSIKSRCRACSLAEPCRPEAVRREAKQWRRDMVQRISHDAPP